MIPLLNPHSTAVFAASRPFPWFFPWFPLFFRSFSRILRPRRADHTGGEAQFGVTGAQEVGCTAFNGVATLYH